MLNKNHSAMDTQKSPVRYECFEGVNNLKVMCSSKGKLPNWHNITQESRYFLNATISNTAKQEKITHLYAKDEDFLNFGHALRGSSEQNRVEI